MEYIDESQKVIGRMNILVYYDPNVKILLNRRLCELVVWLCNIASRFCLPLWKRCEVALPICQLSLKELYRQLVLGETLIQGSSSQHFWKLREQGKTEGKEGKTVEYLHSCDRALKDWQPLVVTVKKPGSLRCERINHGLKLRLSEEQQLFVEHSCFSADQERVPLKFRKGKVFNLHCTSEHWLKLSIIGAPHGALMVQFIFDLYWHMRQVNASLLKSQGPGGHKAVSASRRWGIIGCNILLNQVYEKLSGERERGLGSSWQCQDDCKLLLTKLRYVIEQGQAVEDTQRQTASDIRCRVAEFVLHKLEDRFSLVNTYQVVPQRTNSRAEFQFLPQYLNIDRANVKIVRYITRGGFGAVYECTCFGESLAAKCFNYVPSDAHLKDTFRNELLNLYKLRHSHIVQLVGYYVPEERQHAILIELMESEDLWEKIVERKKIVERTLATDSGQHGLNYSSPSASEESGMLGEAKLYPLHVAVDILLQIARGMKYSHDSGVMHRDIKSKNILVKRITSNCNSERIDLSKEGYAYVKLTDFGLSTRLMYPHSNVGTSFWKAPEVIGKAQQEYSKSADVYSFAITCSEVFAGEVPFGTSGRLTDDQLLDRLMYGDRPSLANCPPYLADYIRRCWDSNPGSRPSFADICIVLQHYKGVLMRPKSDANAAVGYHISEEEDIRELACHGGLKWVTREALKNGVTTPSHDHLGCSRIPKDILLDCLKRWDYPEQAASSPELGLDESVVPEVAAPSPGNFLEGFEKLSVIQYSWTDVLLNGLREAWQLVGDEYAMWSGGIHDFDNALPWFQRAADNDHPDAFNRLGLCYEAGYGVEKDMVMAEECYTKAAEKNSKSACVCLGLIYWNKAEGFEYWQRALQCQNLKWPSLPIIKFWIHIMRSGHEGLVYENVVQKLYRMSRREDSLGQQLLHLLAGPQHINIKFFVEALRTGAQDKQRATKVIILRNLSREPQMAQKIREFGGNQVLLRLFKESFKPDSRLVARVLVETFCNVNPIDQDQEIQKFLQDCSDLSSGFTPEEVAKFSQIRDQLSVTSPSENKTPGNLSQTHLLPGVSEV